MGVLQRFSSAVVRGEAGDGRGKREKETGRVERAEEKRVLRGKKGEGGRKR